MLLKLDHTSSAINHVMHSSMTVCILISLAAPVTPSDDALNRTVGETLEISVDITGFNLPFTSITWTLDGSELTNATDRVTILNSALDPPMATSTLVVDPVETLMDEGVYNITVENPAGMSTTSYTVSVFGR